jgi:hypothetical protein
MEIGQKRGKLTILEVVKKEPVLRSRHDSHYFRRTYRCICECGREVFRESRTFSSLAFNNCGVSPCRVFVEKKKKFRATEKFKAESFEEFRKRIKKDREKNNASAWIDLFQF